MKKSAEYGERFQRSRIARILLQSRQLRLQSRKLQEKIVDLEKKLLQRDLVIKELNYNLNRINSEIDEEMETAKRIQEGLMPKVLPEMINVKSTAIYIPASKVGGDLYDILMTPSQKTAVLIFDVSGHGIPAALVGAMAKMLFAHFIEKTESPAEVFRLVNRQICSFIGTEQYLTAFLGIIDPVKNNMTYSRAGHVPPLVFHKKNNQITRLDSRGFFIGHSALQNLAEYWEQTINLEPGDKILFYTDGLTEGCNPSGEMYGSERLRNDFSKYAGLELENVLEYIVTDQTKFRSGIPLRDDFTLLCIELGNTESLLNDSGFSREDEPNIRIVNSYADIDKTCAAILKDMDRNGFNDKSIKQFKICTYEMLTNALLHGNKGDSSKKVIVFYKITLFAAAISVMDEGQGFNYNDIPNPLLPENRIKDHGRGLFLIRHYLDDVTFNARGNRITGRKFHHGV
ncbi:MAG TPA: SpoIIE family protein phosphatase [Chitinispirillaceae bacterium]|nr:SpoIIE family protein phosphatase [Chitinispirillaceae bacterium]